MTRALSLALSAALLASCADGTTDTGDTGPAECEVGVDPFPGLNKVANYRTNIVIEWSNGEPDEQATVSLATADGTDVPGTTTYRGEGAGATVVFTPDAPLAASSDYVTTVSWTCEGAERETPVAWRTSDVGAPAGDNVSPDTTYRLDLTTANLVQPASLAVQALIEPFLDQLVWVEVKSVTDSQIEMFGALPGDDDVEGEDVNAQSPCLPTLAFPEPATFTDPYFELASDETTIEVAGIEAVLLDLSLSGSFAPDGSYLDGVRLAASIDTRRLPVDLLAEFEIAPEEICERAADLNVNCEPCDDGEVACLSVEIDRIQAPIDTAVNLEEKVEPCLDAACAEHPACEID